MKAYFSWTLSYVNTKDIFELHIQKIKEMYQHSYPLFFPSRDSQHIVSLQSAICTILMSTLLLLGYTYSDTKKFLTHM